MALEGGQSGALFSFDTLCYGLGLLCLLAVQFVVPVLYCFTG